MSALKNQKILIGVLAVIVLGAVAYYYFGGSSNIPVGIIVPGDSQPVGQDILVLVQKLDSVSIDQSIFTGALFNSLIDYSTVLSSEEQGRLNPFAQIGTESSSVVVQTSMPIPQDKKVIR